MIRIRVWIPDHLFIFAVLCYASAAYAIMRYVSVFLSQYYRAFLRIRLELHRV